jgi:hypothetical protein
MSAVQNIVEATLLNQAGVPNRAPEPYRDASAIVVLLPSPADRSVNVRMLEAMHDRMRQIHGDLSNVSEPYASARAAMGRMPIPVLGQGLTRTLASMPDDPKAYRNVLGILIHVDAMLRRGECLNAADAFVRAFAAHHHTTLAETRNRLIQASHDCEFFSPEVVLMLLALKY